MSYYIPLPGDVVARFPAFAAVPTAVIAGAIAEAQTRVDGSWLPSDFTIAIMLYAAHVMTLDGFGTSAEAALAGAGAMGFQSLHAGGLRLDRRPRQGQSEATSLYAETTYGRRFLALLAVNQPPILVP
jgi:hypothetical protein